jgi:hypothetical protein
MLVIPFKLEGNKFRKSYRSHFQVQFLSQQRNQQEAGGKKTQHM